MENSKQRLLVSVRGKNEALTAVEGGSHIIDVEFPASALGTPYPLNIKAVRNAIPEEVPVATNVGEEQTGRSNACQAALGVALAGADIIKVGMAKMPLGEAEKFGPDFVRTVKTWFPEKKCVPALFADERLAEWYIDPLKQGAQLGTKVKADGMLIDTFDKTIGKGLLDYYSLDQVQSFVEACHNEGIEAWIAGSIAAEELPSLWQTGVDVVCVRAAACKESSGPGRFGEVDNDRVAKLTQSIRSGT